MNFLNLINAAVREEMAKVIDEEVTAAQARIADRIRQSADKLALQVLAQYDVENKADRLIITVKKGAA